MPKFERMRSVKRAVEAVFLALALLGCWAKPRLADLAAPVVTLEMSQPKGQVGGTFVARIFSSKAVRPGTRCDRPAPAAVATFNGVALKRLTGTFVADEMEYDRDCLLEFAFPGPIVTTVEGGAFGGRRKLAAGMETTGPIPQAAQSAGPGVLRIEDSSAKWMLEVPDAFTPRVLTLVVPGDGVLHRSEPVVIRWSPATDILDGHEVGVSIRGAVAGSEGSTSIEKLDAKGTRLAFVVPANLPRAWNGPVLLTFHGTASVRPAVGRCPVGECTIHIAFSVPPLRATLGE